MVHLPENLPATLRKYHFVKPLASNLCGFATVRQLAEAPHRLEATILKQRKMLATLEG
jgi:hypothetical protein